MEGKQRIESLTSSWYGYSVFVTLGSVLLGGIGLFRLFFAMLGLLFSFAITFFIGRRLLARSSITRKLLVVVSVLSTIFGALAILKFGRDFLSGWSFGGLIQIGMAIASVAMNVRSFAVLTDSRVKSYFARV